MSTGDDRRLIEDYLPIEAISKEASREKSVRKGHISTLHLWWARRPLVACRAAVYGALVPASRFRPKNGSEEKRESLTRANAARFVETLCKYPGDPQVIAQAQEHILEAHAERLTRENGKKITVEDIKEERAPRPKVLDMFAGGGAIPLEALRLGCEAYALDLNPVAYIIELCTLVYPQKYGKPDPNARGMTGPKNAKGETTWGGLAQEVRYWGNWVLKQVKADIGDLYPLIPDPEFKGKKTAVQAEWFKGQATEDVPAGYLMPVAYLWTRTVTCKSPHCRASVPLLKQTWLCKKQGRYVALKIVAPRGKKEVRFEVVETYSENGLGFDPTGFSKGGNATCPFCGTVADVDYVKDEGWAGRLGLQPLALAAFGNGKRGKVYLEPEGRTHDFPSEDGLRKVLQQVCGEGDISVPDEPIANQPGESKKNTLGITVRPYGIRTFGDLFTTRQQICLLAFSRAIRQIRRPLQDSGSDPERIAAISTCLASMLDKLADFNSTQCTWNYTGGRGVKNSFGRQTLAMTWDFCETNPFNPEGASWISILDDIPCASELLRQSADYGAHVLRGSATSMPFEEATFDAIVTDPPYYDNVPYADISDFFYVWLKRSIGKTHPEHFATVVSPKKSEAIADADRHGGSRDDARRAYEEMMATAFQEANRCLKPAGEMVVVYAHKTTLGWATLVDALRKVHFMVSEAWPLDTEKPGRLRDQESAALASSIFLVARKREGAETGHFEETVKPELEQIVRERVETLWAMGISGADLVIACVGAGLRAFTRFAQVEYANGEEVPAERFLTEVETVVLETILARLSKEVGGNGGKYSLAGLDPVTRFYVLWRYTYKAADLDAGEAIIFANGTHVELDGLRGLSSRTRPLLEKEKGTYRLLDYSERGDDKKLGMPSENGQPAPLLDALQRTLWLMEKRPGHLEEFLREAQPNLEQMRLVAQALAGTALKGKSDEGKILLGTTQSEQAALGKLLANWRALIEQPAPPLFEK